MKSAKIPIAFVFLLAFTVCGAAQTRGLDNLDLMKTNRQSTNSVSIVTPNELNGFEFFKTGKLNNVKIGVSTKTDIEKIFGSACEKPCDYDSNWTITFDYFSASQVLVTNLNKPGEKNYVPKKEVIGKIESVALRPKKRISFENTAFSGSFKKYSLVESGYLNSAGKDGVLFDIFVDSYGLQYLIFDKFTSDNFKDTFDLRKRFANFRKGDLITIKYTIPEELESRFFIEQQ